MEKRSRSQSILDSAPTKERLQSCVSSGSGMIAVHYCFDDVIHPLACAEHFHPRHAAYARYLRYIDDADFDDCEQSAVTVTGATSRSAFVRITRDTSISSSRETPHARHVGPQQLAPPPSQPSLPRLHPESVAFAPSRPRSRAWHRAPFRTLLSPRYALLVFVDCGLSLI